LFDLSCGEIHIFQKEKRYYGIDHMAIGAGKSAAMAIMASVFNSDPQNQACWIHSVIMPFTLKSILR